MIDLLTLHAHNKKCKSCGKFDNYMYVRYMYFKNVVHTIIATKCPYCNYIRIIKNITERTDK